MHLANVPFLLTSLSFLVPWSAARDTGNTLSATTWGTLTVTSILLHATKEPYHLHGPGNCVGWILIVDTAALYAATARAIADAWVGGSVGPFMAAITVLYAGVMFYGGYMLDRFAFDRYADMSILSHATIHLLAAWGGTAAIYIRAFKNGHPSSL